MLAVVRERVLVVAGQRVDDEEQDQEPARVDADPDAEDRAPSWIDLPPNIMAWDGYRSPPRRRAGSDRAWAGGAR